MATVVGKETSERQQSSQKEATVLLSHASKRLVRQALDGYPLHSAVGRLVMSTASTVLVQWCRWWLDHSDSESQ